MPTTPETDEPQVDPIIERAITRTRDLMGASDRMPVRVMVLFVIAIACTALAPLPINVIGVAAIVLLALDTTMHRR